MDMGGTSNVVNIHYEPEELEGEFFAIFFVSVHFHDRPLVIINCLGIEVNVPSIQFQMC